MGTLKPQSKGPVYSNTVIGTLAVDGWAVAFGTARRGLGGLWLRSLLFSLYQQPIHQRPVYQLHIIRRGTIITFKMSRVNVSEFAQNCNPRGAAYM